MNTVEKLEFKDKKETDLFNILSQLRDSGLLSDDEAKSLAKIYYKNPKAYEKLFVNFFSNLNSLGKMNSMNLMSNENFIAEKNKLVKNFINDPDGDKEMGKLILGAVAILLLLCIIVSLFQ